MDTSIVDTAQSVQTCCTAVHDVWLWVAVAEFVLLLFLLLSRKENRKSEIRKKILKESDVDFGNTVRSSFLAEPLYKELMRKCHPDRFAPDEEKMRVADDITMRMSKSRNDLKTLEILKEEAINKLHINF